MLQAAATTSTCGRRSISFIARRARPEFSKIASQQSLDTALPAQTQAQTCSDDLSRHIALLR